MVGPNFSSTVLPGYPTNPRGTVREDAFAGRKLRELNFDSESLKIGEFRAIDYFNDGSFYVLDAVGHTKAHICALARTTDDTFIFMGGDAGHHGGEFRPTAYRPLPDSISPSPLTKLPSTGVCPGSIFEAIHRTRSRTEPFYVLTEGMNVDLPAAQATLEKMTGFDAYDNVFVIIAHDAFLLDIVDFYPKSLNRWKEKRWAETGRWRFLGDFAVAAKAVQA